MPGPLERTPDMEGMPPDQRAALYKQRAAAAGIGQPPSTASAQAAAPRPAAAAPAPAPARPAAPAAVAERPAGTGVPAKVAAAAAARREQVAAVAKREPAPGAAEKSERLVYVWPHLVTIEFMAAVLILLSLVVVSIILQSRLEAHANPDRTPNPSKAPWYFLNLQELLLHMHPALAGVIVPTAALIALAAIPYIDRDTDDVGKWFGQPNAIPIAIFTTIYTSIIIPIMLLLDEEQTCSVCNLKRLLESIAHATGLLVLTNILVSGVILPIIIMLGPIVILVIIMRRVWNANMREIMIGLFTGFVVTFMLLTISGTVFRGPGMHLYWPWNMPPSTD